MKSMQNGFSLIELLIVLAIMGVVSSLAIPQYQRYVAKTQVQRVVYETGVLKTAIELCILAGKTEIGNAIHQCNPQATGSSIQAGNSLNGPQDQLGFATVVISLTDNTTITATFGNSAAAILAGNTLTWSRQPGGSWVCTSNVDVQYRAADCGAAVI